MKEIKFKCWDKHEKKFIKILTMSPHGDWVKHVDQGYLFKNDEVDEFDLLQYTGLEDDEGQEIFEGDIIELSFYDDYSDESITIESGCIKTGKVIFTSGAFYIDSNKDYFNLYDISEYSYIKVLSNIFKNPELLGV